MKLWLHDNDIEMNLKGNEEKSVIAEKLIRRMKSRIYKHVTAVSKSEYINKVDEILNKCKTHIKEQ